MSELKVYRISGIEFDSQFYHKSEADKVIAELKEKLKEQTSIAEEGWKEFRTYHTSYAEAVKELCDKNKEIAKLKADYKEACDRLQTANLIKDEQKAKADELLMKVSGLEKLVETADKIIKEKGGFTIKEIKFGGVKLEGIKEADK